jgi:hypothetical protein
VSITALGPTQRPIQRAAVVPTGGVGRSKAGGVQTRSITPTDRWD